MANLQTLLNDPIKWTNWTTDGDLLSLLSDLQANILKGHGRDHTRNIFLSFRDMESQQVSALLNELSFVTTSALEQLREAAAFRVAGVSGGTVVCVMLGIGGYSRLGVASANIPGDFAFRQGMVNRGRLDPMKFHTIPDFDAPSINDPDRAKWEAGGAWDPGNPVPDAMILIADDEPALVERAAAALDVVFNRHHAVILGADIGLAQRRIQPNGDPKGEGLEHFGYVDGASQPLFLDEDLPPAPGAWNETFKPKQFIVPDPGNPTTFSCGSYFVYRKLEQNVKLFKDQEDALATALGLVGPDRERVGALIVGRFEDATPVTLHPLPVGAAPHNNFNYDGEPPEPAAQNCPFRAHIRKTNPRDGNERLRIMARRGITYGERAPRPPGADFVEGDHPTGGVGLIFMAYMADINEQFEFTQSAWANNTGFPFPTPPLRGVDPVISQVPNGPDPEEVRWTDPVTNVTTTNIDFQQSVTLMGGEYFFAPSISFLQSAGQFVAPALIA